MIYDKVSTRCHDPGINFQLPTVNSAQFIPVIFLHDWPLTDLELILG